MDRSYVRMMAVSGYQSLKIDDVHNAMTSPVFQKVITFITNIFMIIYAYMYMEQ
jgi:hypothetical protein